MAGQSLEFTISASDQASKVVTSVQGKIQNFGKDVGKSIAGVLGPMALVGFAVSKVTEYLAEMEKKAKEAFDFGAGLSNAADKLGVTVEQFQQINNAAEMTGSSVDEVGKAFLLAAKRLEEARSGNQDAIDGLGALGIGVEDLSKTKPEDVLARLAGAMAAGKDPTEAMAISMAALGNSAKELQKVLAKGFDIKGAMVDTEGLTEGEAAFLRETEKKKRAKQNREKVSKAKEETAREFLENDPEGKKILEAVRIDAGRIIASASGGFGGPVNVSASKAAESKGVQDQVVAALARREEEKRRREEGIATNPANVQAAKDLVELDEKRKKAEKEKADAEKAAGITPKEAKPGKDQTQFPGELSRAINVSSLREIGGGMAGEVAVSEEQYRQNQLDLLRKAVEHLANLDASKSGFDFTKARDVAPYNPIKNIA